MDSSVKTYQDITYTALRVGGKAIGTASLTKEWEVVVDRRKADSFVIRRKAEAKPSRQDPIPGTSSASTRKTKEVMGRRYNPPTVKLTEENEAKEVGILVTLMISRKI